MTCSLLGGVLLKHIFIINPNAGTVDKSIYTLNIIENIFRKRHEECFTFITEYSGHATNLVKKMCDFFSTEVIRFYACGGLGTLNEVINGIMDFSKVEVAFYPMGTSNDLAKAFSRYPNQLYSIRELIEGDLIKIDLIKVNNDYAANAVCCGFDARVGRDMGRGYMKYLGVLNHRLPYFFPIIKNLVTNMYEKYIVEVDGVSYNGEYSVVSIMNNFSYGGYYCPRGDALIDDGILNVLLYRIENIFGITGDLSAFKQGTLPERSKKIVLADGQKIKISLESGGPFILNYDGQAKEAYFANIEVLHQALNLIVPGMQEEYLELE